MHSSGSAKHFEEVSELSSNRLDQDIPSLTIDTPHLSDVLSKMAKLHEIGESFLIEIGRKYIRGEANCLEEPDKVPRNHNVADAKRREKHFAKRADVDNTLVHIKS